jgi:hypothetical protein
VETEVGSHPEGTRLILVKLLKKFDLKNLNYRGEAMKLSYRGVSYEQNSPQIETMAGAAGGTYRGATWNHQYLRHIPVPQPKVDLKYRGVAYSTGDPIDVEVVRLRREYTQINGATANTTAIATKQKPAKSDRQQVLQELHSTHLDHLRRNLERRLQIAREKGDNHLIQLLEAESRQLA